MARSVSVRKMSGDVRILKLCMDAKEDRQTYEKIRNDTNCEIIDKQYFSTPKGVVWAVVEYRDQKTETQSPEQVSGGVSNEEEE
jgi:hypothetical protein